MNGISSYESPTQGVLAVCEIWFSSRRYKPNRLFFVLLSIVVIRFAMEAIPRRNSFSSASINFDPFRDPPAPDEQHDLEQHIPPTGLQETAFGNEHMTRIRSSPETESQQAREISQSRLHTHNSDAEDQDDILSLQPSLS